MEFPLSVNNLVITRGGRVVLPCLSLTVPAGQITGLLGPSGSGKSTLLRALVGVQQITSGEVRVLGLPAGSPALRRRVGYATQAPSAYDDLSVEANLRYFGALAGATSARVEQTLHDVDLYHARKSLFRQLSGGQRSRVSLAAALVGEPEVLILDEPTVGLDPLLRRDLWDLFARLAAQGRTLVVSSHVMDEATRCDQLVLLREGLVLAQETPSSLLERTGCPDAESAFLKIIEDAA